MEVQSDTFSGLPSTLHEITCSSSSSEMDSQMNEGPCFNMLLQEGEQGYNETPPQARMRSTTKKSQRGRNFSIEEDILLVTAWLNTDIDLIQGNDTKPKTFWERISKNYHEHKTEIIVERSIHSLSNRWSIIQLSTNKFCGYLTQVESKNPNGVSEQDKINEAKAMYRKFQKITFQFEHCWNVLRNVPKWNSHMVQMKSRRKSIGTCSPSTPEAIHLGEDNNVENALVDFERPHLGEDNNVENALVDFERPHLGEDNNVENAPVDFERPHLGEDNNVENALGDFERPLGKKTSKERERKRKSKDCPTLNIMEVLSKLKDEKKRSYEEINKQIYTAKEEIICIEKQKLEIEQRKEEWEIMMMDISSLSPMQQEYIHSRQMEILEKRRIK